VNVRTLDATINGTAAAHEARVELTAEDVDAMATASGGLVAGTWRGMLDDLEIDERVLGPWRLEAPSPIRLGRGVVTVATTCLRHASNARWCSALDVQGRPEDSLVVSAQNFDLATLKTEIDPEYWRRWVTVGKPGTLMPGFAATEGGPLDEPQINSLVEYLTKAYPRPVKGAKR